MAVFACPRCKHAFDIADADVFLEARCPRCHGGFDPSGIPSVEPVLLQDRSPLPSRPDPKNSPKKTRAGITSGQIAFLIAAGTIMFAMATAAIVFLVMLISNRAIDPSRDPYHPDCAVARKWLRSNYGKDVQIVGWGQRTIIRGHNGDHAYLSAAFRIGDRGHVSSAFFTIGAGDFVESATVTD